MRVSFSEKQNNVVSRAQRLLAARKYSEAVSTLESIQFQKSQRSMLEPLLGEVYYGRGKMYQGQGKDKLAIEDFNRVLHFDEVLTATRELIRDRLNLIKNQTTRHNFINNTYEGMMQEVCGSSIRFLEPTDRSKKFEYVHGWASLNYYISKQGKFPRDSWTRKIRDVKNGNSDPICECAELMAAFLKTNSACRLWLESLDFLVPIPSNEQKNSARGGMDSTECLSEELSKYVSIPHRSRLIHREEGDRNSRNMNQDQVLNEYYLENGVNDRIKSRDILLVDDVLTRGYTVRACSKHFLDAGASRVYVLTLALTRPKK